ncbi:MAG TPA: hypothetical protein VFM21_01380, partial [Terriglobia bacterium]|nr:hypothetical protein [Terriglobia bacterium]
MVNPVSLSNGRRWIYDVPCFFLISVCLLLFPAIGSAQDNSQQEEKNPTPPTANVYQTNPAKQPLSLKTLPSAILHDQKPIWTYPVRGAKGEHWKPTLAVVLTTTGLVFLDSHEAP